MLGMGGDSYCDESGCYGDIPYGTYPAGGGGTAGKATSSTNIFDAIMSGVNASTKILSTRYGVPQLNPGQYLQTGPNGQTIQYQLAPGQSTGFPGLSTFGSGSGGSSLLLIGGGLLVVLMMAGKKN